MQAFPTRKQKARRRQQQSYSTPEGKRARDPEWAADPCSPPQVPGYTGPAWRSPGAERRAAELWSRLPARGGVLGLFQSQNSSRNSILPPQKLESRNTYRPFAVSKKRLHSQSAKIVQKCLHGSEPENSLFKILFHKLLGCLPCCHLSQFYLLGNSRPLFLLWHVLQKSVSRNQ